jgi:hypothetical protein
MKKTMLKISLIISTALMYGCASTSWVNADDTKATEAKISEAKIKCQIDDKMYDWISKSSQRNLLVRMQTSDSEKQKMEHFYAEKEKELYAEIDKCMSSEGLKKQ